MERRKPSNLVTQLKPFQPSNKIFLRMMGSGIFKGGLREPIDGGKWFVLTASAAEMATFGNSSMRAMMSTFPEAIVKPFLAKYLRPESLPDGTALFAPYGLRKVESILVNAYGRENVAVVHPSKLDLFVGPETEFVGITSMDPLGLAYVGMTYNPIVGFGGEPVNKVEFLRLMRHPIFKKYHPKKILGGFGIWQVRDLHLQEKLGIDLLYMGEAERDLVAVIEKIRHNEPMPKCFKSDKLYEYELVPTITRASGHGSVEVMRGCGRRCQFCSPDYRTKYDFPLEHIMREVDLNTKYGCHNVFLVTEDIFLYGQHARFVPNREKLCDLFRALAQHPGVHTIAISHASLAPVVVDKHLLEELTPIFIEKSFYKKRGKKYVGVDIGIESGSVRIMKKYLGGKALPLSVDDWPDIVVEGTGIMNDSDWYPMYTFVLGFPEETDEDMLATLELMDRLKDYKVLFVPLLFIPLEEAVLRNAKKASVQMMTPLHWEFVMDAWRHNMRMWAEELKPLVSVMGFFGYGLYSGHIHGHRSIKAIMRFLGMPGMEPIRNVIWKRCDARYCFPRKSDDKAEARPSYQGELKIILNPAK